jgi:hypothetical protein
MKPDEGPLLAFLRSYLIDGLSVAALDGGFLVRLPFSDSMGEPIEIFVATTPSGALSLDDLGHTAGMLLQFGQHGEEATGHLLVKSLADANGINMDYDQGILSQMLPSVVDPLTTLNFMKVLICTQTAIPALQQRRRLRRVGKRLGARLAGEIRQLRLPEHVERGALVSGKNETWTVDYRYVCRTQEEASDVILVTVDFGYREPRERAAHVLTLAYDVLALPRRPKLRVVYDVDGNGSAESARRAANLVVDYQERIGYRAYNYDDPEQRADLKALTLQELSPILSQSKTPL